jgi:hypothetical protein
METIIYRKSQQAVGPLQTASISSIAPTSEAPQGEALHPDIFYPVVTIDELTMWSQWLPTAHVYRCDTEELSQSLLARLKQLHAPAAVIEECQFSWTLGVFDSYEVMTPERRHLRDPLVLGRIGDQRYRIALWGESLRPLNEIRELVHQSLAVRQLAARWRLWTTATGGLLGLAFGLWAALQTPSAADDVIMSLLYGIMGLCGSLSLQLHIPEEKQQRFLDRYRS